MTVRGNNTTARRDFYLQILLSRCCRVTNTSPDSTMCFSQVPSPPPPPDVVGLTQLCIHKLLFTGPGPEFYQQIQFWEVTFSEAQKIWKRRGVKLPKSFIILTNCPRQKNQKPSDLIISLLPPSQIRKQQQQHGRVARVTGGCSYKE